jgi:hypothetical protein
VDTSQSVPVVAAVGDQPAALVSPHAEDIIRHHAYQGATNDCGPYCVAMIVNAVSPFDVVAAQLARELDRPTWRGLHPVVRRVPHSATFPWGVVEALTANGLRAAWRMGATAARLRSALAANRLPMVVLGGWRPLWGHWVIVLGWDPERGWALADPGRPEMALRWYPEAKFARQWRAMGRTVVEVDLPASAHESSER